MDHAVYVHEVGGPEKLSFETYNPGKLAAGQVLIRHLSIGLNYIDTYFRSGLYPVASGTPFIPGNEASAQIEDVGSGVTEFKPGDRVVYAGAIGAYCTRRIVAADQLVKLPDEIDDDQAAAVFLKGLTARYLLRETFPVKHPMYILFHAAAGGVGLLAGQLGSHLGATMIGTVGSPAKGKLALENGYDHVIDYSKEDFVERVKEITQGESCHAVFDSIGEATFPMSLDCIRPRGMWISFGQSSGPISPFNLGLLSQKGSLYATRPSLFSYISTRQALLEASSDLFAMLAKGVMRIEVRQKFALADAVKAHQALESRQTRGASVIKP